jgi:hypothetical protein
VAELRVMLHTVVAVLAPSDVCDRVEAPEGAALLRVAPHEVLILGARGSDLSTPHDDALVDDVSDAWVSLVLEGADASEAFARLSELRLPSQGWIQGDVAHAAAKVLVEPDRITMLVPSMLAAHVEERIRADAAEVLAS